MSSGMSSRNEAELGGSLDGLARRAADGDREALSELLREIQHPMYRLALRFLGNPDDTPRPWTRAWVTSTRRSRRPSTGC